MPELLLLFPKRIVLSLKRTVKVLAPIVEKLSVNFWFMALMAVIIPISAMMPKAIIATVNPVRNLLLRMVRKASENVSRKFIDVTSLTDYKDSDWILVRRRTKSDGLTCLLVRPGQPVPPKRESDQVRNNTN